MLPAVAHTYDVGRQCSLNWVIAVNYFFLPLRSALTEFSRSSRGYRFWHCFFYLALPCLYTYITYLSR
ncbi:hypothetical protein F5X96DRAFT_657721 [Biscogniauxia mediterranea]|nr:hypothetical protein F5X96DRAFT_657721 [Biscogniauxia mediterranea]